MKRDDDGVHGFNNLATHPAIDLRKEFGCRLVLSWYNGPNSTKTSQSPIYKSIGNTLGRNFFLFVSLLRLLWPSLTTIILLLYTELQASNPPGILELPCPPPDFTKHNVPTIRAIVISLACALFIGLREWNVVFSCCRLDYKVKYRYRRPNSKCVFVWFSGLQDIGEEKFNLARGNKFYPFSFYGIALCTLLLAAHWQMRGQRGGGGWVAIKPSSSSNFPLNWKFRYTTYLCCFMGILFSQQMVCVQGKLREEWAGWPSSGGRGLQSACEPVTDKTLLVPPYFVSAQKYSTTLWLQSKEMATQFRYTCNRFILRWCECICTQQSTSIL